MRNLNNFIIERLKLNKNTKISNSNFSEKYCIVVPFDVNWSIFCEKYEQQSSWSHGDYQFFIIPIEDVIEKTTELINYKEGIDIYKIPNKYDSFEELKTDHENKKFRIEGGNLEKLKI